MRLKKLVDRLYDRVMNGAGKKEKRHCYKCGYPVVHVYDGREWLCLRCEEHQ